MRAKYKELAGAKFGRWTVESPAPPHVTPNGKKVAMWMCVCDCGTTRAVRRPDLTFGRSRSCGCLQAEVAAEVNAIDLTDRRFGRLRAERREAGRWSCVCDCGGRISVGTTPLTSGNTKSCGCLRTGPTSFRHKEVVTYNSAHYRIRRSKGAARNYACVDCGAVARDWSYDGADPEQLTEEMRGVDMAYSLKPEHYWARCKPCHKTLDNAARRAA